MGAKEGKCQKLHIFPSFLEIPRNLRFRVKMPQNLGFWAIICQKSAQNPGFSRIFMAHNTIKNLRFLIENEEKRPVFEKKVAKSSKNSGI